MYARNESIIGSPKVVGDFWMLGDGAKIGSHFIWDPILAPSILDTPERETDLRCNISFGRRVGGCSNAGTLGQTRLPGSCFVKEDMNRISRYFRCTMY